MKKLLLVLLLATVFLGCAGCSIQPEKPKIIVGERRVITPLIQAEVITLPQGRIS